MPAMMMAIATLVGTVRCSLLGLTRRDPPQARARRDLGGMPPGNVPVTGSHNSGESPS